MAETLSIQQVYCYKINTFTKTNNDNNSKLHAAVVHHAEQSHTAAAAAAAAAVAELINYNEEWRTG